MIRKGDFKLIHYVGFEDELFDLASDPEELTNLAANPTFKAVYDDLLAELRAIVIRTLLTCKRMLISERWSKDMGA